MSSSSWDMSKRCTTCRGWSCLQCAWAIAHHECQMDCPDFNDSRMQPEEPWGESPDAVSSDAEPPAQRALRIVNTERPRMRVSRRHQSTVSGAMNRRVRSRLQATTG